MPAGKKPTFRSLMVTQLVSGVWHGLFPGYAMFFVNTTFMFDSAKTIYRCAAGLFAALSGNAACPAGLDSSASQHTLRLSATRALHVSLGPCLAATRCKQPRAAQQTALPHLLISCASAVHRSAATMHILLLARSTWMLSA